MWGYIHNMETKWLAIVTRQLFEQLWHGAWVGIAAGHSNPATLYSQCILPIWAAIHYRHLLFVASRMMIQVQINVDGDIPKGYPIV